MAMWKRETHTQKVILLCWKASAGAKPVKKVLVYYKHFGIEEVSFTLTYTCNRQSLSSNKGFHKDSNLLILG